MIAVQKTVLLIGSGFMANEIGYMFITRKKIIAGYLTSWFADENSGANFD
jgi:hypothetical protein